MKMIKKVEDGELLTQVAALEMQYFKQDGLTLEQLKNIVGNTAEIIFACVEKQQVLGYIYLNVVASDGFADIMKVLVVPAYRGQGIGSELVTYAEGWCQKQALHRVLLEVRTSNLGAISLYQKLGYRVLSTRKNFYTFPEEDAFVLEKKLK